MKFKGDRMSKIKLFSGMDFSGKSTIIKNIDLAMPGVFKVQKKFLTPIDTIEKVRKRDTWLPPEEWKPLLQNTIKKDISDYKEDGMILQDSLWIIKYIATKLEDNSPEDYEEIEILNELLGQYPEMDSFYITVSIEERIKRLNIRKSLGEEITGSDKILFSKEKFERIEEYYRETVLKHFPNTKIIDTTNCSIEETVEKIINDSNFIRDL